MTYNRSVFFVSIATALVYSFSSCAQAPATSFVTEKELVITDLSIVNDARTLGPNGPWSFGGLMTRMATSELAVGQFVKDWLSTWKSDQSVNSLTVAARPAIESQVIKPWRDKDGASSFETWNPNFANAPFRLLAIIYRPDLVRRDGAGKILNAGEGRFVFAVLDKAGEPLPFTVIFEYGLVANDRAGVKAWAERWHSLGGLTFGPQFNSTLQQITDRFSGRNADPSKPNGSSLNQLRTNEIALGNPWQLREFQVLPTGKLENVTVKQTPDTSLIAANPSLLSKMVNDNASAIKDGTVSIPEKLGGIPIVGGTSDVLGNNFFWPRLAIADNDLRHDFGMLTCNGCHNVESGPKADQNGNFGFRHVSGRKPNEKATLSVFLTGGDVPDPADPSKSHRVGDIEARKLAFQQALNPISAAILATDDLRPDDLSVAHSRQGRAD